MRVSWSSSEDIAFKCHIIPYQRVSKSPDFKIKELHERLKMANMGQRYTGVIYPKALDARKARIRKLASSETHAPTTGRWVVDGKIEQ